MRLNYFGSDCPGLSLDEQQAAHDAAAQVLGERDPVIEYAAHLIALDRGEDVSGSLWERAEAAAIAAATRGWYRVPESLVLVAD
jgi:hypothetical protein